MAFALSPERERELDDVLKRYPTKRAACLPALWLCQKQHGWITPEAIEYVAKRLDLTTAHVKGVVTFYTMYFEHPVAPNVVWVCRTLSCNLRGAKTVQEHLEKRFGCRPGENSKDGKFTLKKAECLAACGQAPMVQINDEFHENLTLEKLDTILDEHAARTSAVEAEVAMPGFEPLLTRRYAVKDGHRIAVAEQHGVYKQARRALTTMKPEEIREEVKKASIRGRGGAGFPAGVKWGFLAPKAGDEVYLVVNADESEPGTFKDRTIMMQDPHRFLEGILITCYAIGAHKCWIYVRGELAHCIARLDQAIAEAREKGYIGARPFGIAHAVDVWTHSGAGAYICGEETGLLSSLEGKRGEPKLKPPFPAIKGAFGMPTIVNNVETIAQVADIVELGGEAWCGLSRLAPRDGGTRLYGVSGHVKTPGVYEGPVGITLRELIYDLGGGMLHEGRPLKAVIPGGSSTPVLRPDRLVHAPDEKHPLHQWHGKSEIDVPMGVDTYRALGTMLGTCCAIVMDDSVSMVEAARNLMRFYAHESCGQCTPCREGCGWLVDILDGLVAGRGKPSDVDLLVDVSNNMMGNTICAFADGTAMPMLGFVRQFRDEFVAAAKSGLSDSRLDAGVRSLLVGASAGGAE